MSGLAWVDAQARGLFEARGLASITALCDLADGEIVSSARTRCLRRLVLGDDVFYVKTQDLRSATLPARRLPSYTFRGSPVAREARSLELLAELGFRTPPLVASGQERGRLLPRAAALITRELTGFVDLVRFLASDPPREEADGVIARAEELVRRAHAAGIVLLGAKYRNILVPREAGEPLALVDQPDLRRSKSERLRAKDWRHMRLDRERYGREVAP